MIVKDEDGITLFDIFFRFPIFFKNDMLTAGYFLR